MLGKVVREDNCTQSLVKPVFYLSMDDKKKFSDFSKRKETQNLIGLFHIEVSPIKITLCLELKYKQHAEDFNK